MHFTAGLLLVAGVVYLLLLSPFVQTRLVKFITQRIEETTGVSIRIGGVDFRPMRSLVLNDVLLKDFKSDTLLYCRDIRIKADSFNIIKRTFVIEEILFDGATFNLWVEDSTNITNIEMWLESLQRNRPEESPADGVRNAGSPDWLVGLKRIGMRNSRFTYREEILDTVEYGVNWTDVDCRELNVDISKIDFSGSPQHMEVSDLCFVEKSGLIVKNMGGKVRMSASNLLITDCHFEFERSSVELARLEFNWTPDQHDWKYFTTRMQQYYELGNSSVSFVDLAYFNDILRGIDNTVKCRGVVSNTINLLEGRDLHFELGDNTVFQGSFKSAGLPDVWNTFFDIELRKARLGTEDLSTVYLPWFDRYIPVPQPLYRLPYIDFEQITFKGTFSEFIVKANSVTPSLSGQLSFAYGPCRDSLREECEAMGGLFNFDRIDFGKFTGYDFLGGGRLEGSYDGFRDRHGFRIGANAGVRNLHINGGVLSEAEVALDVTDDRIQLTASAGDSVLQGNAAMTYDFSNTMRNMELRGEIALNDLDYWGMGLGAGKEKTGIVFSLDHSGTGERSFSRIALTDIYYINGLGRFDIDSLCIEDTRDGKYNRTSVRSDVADVSIEGHFKELQATPFMLKLIHNYLPSHTQKRYQWKENNEYLKKFDFIYSMNLKDANRILKVIYPQVSVSHGTRINSRFRHGDEKLNLLLTADTLSYGGINLIGSEAGISGDPEKLDILYKASKIVYGDGYQLHNVRNRLKLADSHLDDTLNWGNWGKKTYSGNLSANVTFTPGEKPDTYDTDILIHPGVIIIDDSVWRVDRSTVGIRGKEVTIKDFAVRRGDEHLTVAGKISENPDEELHVNARKLNLEYFARIALKRHLGLFGMTTGKLTLQDYYKDFMLLSDFEIKHWGINRDTLGTMRLRSYWDSENHTLIVGAQNHVGRDIPLQVDGFYSPATDTLDVSIHLKQVGIERLGVYAPDLFSDTKGFLSGDLQIGGTSRKPDLSGTIRIDSTEMVINDLNTRLLIHDSIRITNNLLLFNRFRLKDKNGHTALLDGTYDILDNKYRLNAGFDDFLVLNTDFTRNESFYGSIQLSGIAELNNSDGNVNVSVNARTEENSRLYIPLTAGGVEQTINFLHFVNEDRTAVQKPQTDNASSNINLDANLEVNDRLNVQLIFDPTVGDILRTTGNGNIKISLDKDGNLSMFGEYQITKGDYLFTLSNLVNKKFVLMPGGTINWNGSPYDARLNINAVYSLKTSINELMPAENAVADENGNDEKVSESYRKIPVECILNLSENLTNPAVKFDIDFPTLESQSRSYIKSLFTSQDEINKQMFSLLVLNRFYRNDNSGDYGLHAQTAGVTTVTEMMSNQLSRWLSQISNNVDIGLAYHVRDPEREIASDEIEVALSTQLLNDRITISANGNMDVGGTKSGTGEESKKTNIAGDFDIEVKLNRQGTLKMKAYSHTDEKILYNNTETIQGVGISYQESFDTLRELLQKYFGFLRRKRNAKSDMQPLNAIND